MPFDLSELRVALVELLRVAPVNSFQIKQFLKMFSKIIFKVLFLELGYSNDIRRLMKSYVIRINILQVIAFLLLKTLIPYSPLPTY